MKHFEKFTERVVCTLEFLSEGAVCWHVHMLTGSWLCSLGSWILLDAAYAYVAVSRAKSLDLNDIKAKNAELAIYWVALNAMICIALSWVI